MGRPEAAGGPTIFVARPCPMGVCPGVGAREWVLRGEGLIVPRALGRGAAAAALCAALRGLGEISDVPFGGW